MSPIPIAGPAVEPVTLAEAKAYLRLDGDDEDTLVASLVAAARHTLELATRRAFIAQSWRVQLDRWPGRAVSLPFAPVLAVTAVRVNAGSGLQVLDAGLYRLDGAADPPTLLIDAAAGEAGSPAGGIEVDASYGFGTAGADVPPPLRVAVLRLVAGWFERRGDEGGDGAMPSDVAALIAPFVRPRIA
jgi:uncharacterized phiE125 gp8 family phage protein